MSRILLQTFREFLASRKANPVELPVCAPGACKESPVSACNILHQKEAAREQECLT